MNVPTEEEITLGSEDCEVLEKSPTYEIPDSEPLDIIYFIDGIQRTQFLGNVPSEKLKQHVPIIFTTSAAIIVKLENGHVRRYIEPLIYEKFIVPELKFLPKEIADVFPKENLHEIPENDFDFTRPANMFRSWVFANVVVSLRYKVEMDIINEFDRTNPDWIVIDGFIRGVENNDKKIGIIKRHGKEWLDSKLKFEVLQNFVKNHGKKLRSCFFRMPTKTGFRPKIISCYSKLLYDLRTQLAINPEFSLIRVETPYEHKDKFESILNTILSYNSPRCNPSDSWDKKIFPIYMAEKMLRGYVKDDRVISAAFRRIY